MIICFGHRRSSTLGTNYNDVWSFSFTTKKWIQIVANMPKGTMLDSFVSEDVIDITTTSLLDPPPERQDHSAVYIGRGCIVMYGGSRKTDELTVLDLQNQQWISIPRNTNFEKKWPVPRRYASFLRDKENIYLQGGTQAGTLLKLVLNDVCTLNINSLMSSIHTSVQETSDAGIRIQQYTSKLQKNPQDIDALSRRSEAYMEQKNWKNAKVDIEAALLLLKKKPNPELELSINLDRGIVLYKEKMYQEAVEHLSIAVITECESRMRVSSVDRQDVLLIELLLPALRFRAKSYLKLGSVHLDMCIKDCNQAIQKIQSYQVPTQEGALQIQQRCEDWLWFDVSFYMLKTNALILQTDFVSAAECANTCMLHITEVVTKPKRNAAVPFLNQNLRFDMTNLVKQAKDYEKKLEEIINKIAQDHKLSQKSDDNFERGKELLAKVRQEKLLQIVDYDFLDEKDGEEPYVNDGNAEIDQAIRYLEVAANFRNQFDPMLTLAEAYLIKCQFQRARKKADDVIRLYSTEQIEQLWRAYLIAGKALVNLREYEAAIGYLTLAFDYVTDVMKHSDHTSELLPSLDTIKQEIKDAERLKNARDLAYTKYGQRGLEMAKQEGKQEQALLSLEKAIEIDRTNAIYHAEYAVLLCNLGKFEQAYKESELAVKLSPNSEQGYLASVHVLRTLNQFIPAARLLERGIQRTGKESLRDELDKLQSAFKDQESAVISYECALLMFEQAKRDLGLVNTGSLIDTVWYYRLTPSDTMYEVLDMLKRATALYSHHSQLQMLYAKVLYILGQFGVALQAVHDTVKIYKEEKDTLAIVQHRLSSPLDDNFLFEATVLEVKIRTEMFQFKEALDFLDTEGGQRYQNLINETSKQEHVTVFQQLHARVTELANNDEAYKTLKYRARTLSAKGNFQDALPLYTQLIQQAEKNNANRSASEAVYSFTPDLICIAESHYFRACCEYVLEQYQACENDCRRSIELVPSLAHYYVLLSQVLMKQGVDRAEQAVTMVTDALDKYAPQNSHLNNAWASLRLFVNESEAKKQAQLAKTLFAQVVSTKYSSVMSKPTISINSGEDPIVKELYSTALIHLNNSLSKRPNDIETLNMRAKCLLKLNRPSMALKDAKKAVKLDKNNSDALYLKGKCEIRKIDLTRAKNTFKDALGRFSTNRKFQKKLEYVIRLESIWIRAQQKCHDAMEAAYKQNNDLAYQYFSEAIQIYPENPLYYCMRARLLLLMAKYQSALQDGEKATSIDPAGHESYMCRAHALMELGRYEEARNVVKEGLVVNEANDALLELYDEIDDREDRAKQAVSMQKKGKEMLKKVFESSTRTQDFSQRGNISIIRLSALANNENDAWNAEQLLSYRDQITVLNLDALTKAQQYLLESSNLDPPNPYYLRDHVESLILSQTQAGQKRKNEEAYDQCATLVQSHPTYADGYELFARLASTVFDDDYEAMFLCIQGLEQQQKNVGILYRLYTIIIDHEQPIIRDGVLMAQLKERAERDEQNDSYEKEAEDLIDSAIDAPDKLLSPISLSELIGTEEIDDKKDSGILGMMFAIPSHVSSVSTKVFDVVKAPFKWGKEEQKDDRTQYAPYQAIQAMRAFNHELMHSAMNMLTEQLENAFENGLRALYVHYDEEQKETLEKVAIVLAKGLNFTKQEAKRRLRSLAIKTRRECAKEIITEFQAIDRENEGLTLRAVSHKKRKPFYHKATFKDKSWEHWKESRNKPFQDAMKKLEIENKDIGQPPKIDSRSRRNLIRTIVDSLSKVPEDQKDDELSKNVFSISDDALCAMKIVSAMNGFGEVYPMLVLFEKLSLRFENRSKAPTSMASDIINVYKILLHILQAIIERSLPNMKVFVNSRELELFEHNQKRIVDCCQLVLDHHWRVPSTDSKMLRVVIISCKVLQLVHCFRVLSNNNVVVKDYLAKLTKNRKRALSRSPPERINRVSSSTSIDNLSAVVSDLDRAQVLSSMIRQTLLESVRNSCRNAMTYFKEKILKKYGDGVTFKAHHLITLSAVLIEFLERYAAQFEHCFPRSLNLMKHVAEFYYYLIRDELEAFANQKLGNLEQVLQIPASIEKLYEFLLDYSARLKPYDLTRIFLPVIDEWINHREIELIKIVNRAVSQDKWQPVTDDVHFTTSVIDLYTFIRTDTIRLKEHSKFLKDKPSSGQSLVSDTHSTTYTTSPMVQQFDGIPLIYVTFSSVISTVFEHYSKKQFEKFTEHSTQVKKNRDQQIEIHGNYLAAALDTMKNIGESVMIWKKQTKVAFDLTEHTTMMAFAMNNISEAMNRLKDYKKELQDQLQQDENPDEEDEDDFDRGTTSAPLTELGLHTETQHRARKKAGMFDALRTIDENLSSAQKQANRHILEMIKFLSDNAFVTIDRTLIAFVKREGTVRNLPSNLINKYIHQQAREDVKEDQTDQVLEQVLTDIFNQLDSQLSILQTMLAPKWYQLLQQKIFDSFINQIKELIVPHDPNHIPNVKQVNHMLQLIKRVKSYLHADGLENELSTLTTLVKMSVWETSKLIDAYGKVYKKIGLYEFERKRIVIKERAVVLSDDEDSEMEESDDEEEQTFQFKDGPDEWDKNQDLTYKQRYEKRVVLRNYLYAFLQSRISHDSQAQKFLQQEQKTIQIEHKTLQEEQYALDTSISHVIKTYDELKQECVQLERENKENLEEYKTIKKIRQLMRNVKTMRTSIKTIREEKREYGVNREQGVDSLLEKEFSELMSKYEKRQVEDVPIGESQKLMKLLQLSKRPVIDDYHRCLYNLVDGHLCIISQPENCLIWVPAVIELDRFEWSNTKLPYVRIDTSKITSVTVTKVKVDQVTISCGKKQYVFYGISDPDILDHLQSFERKVVEIQPTVRDKFKHLDANESIVGHYLCQEGDFYMFTKSIGFVNEANATYYLQLNAISKLVKLKLDGIVIYDLRNHTVTYNGFTNRDQVFESICTAVKTCDSTCNITRTSNSAIVVRKGDQRGTTFKSFLEFW
jgi:Flp pilus assembly protein TadD/uncharacterized protein YqgV (UPF0045/DUF77 family)